MNKKYIVEMIFFLVFFVTTASAISSIEVLYQETKTSAETFINTWISEINALYEKGLNDNQSTYEEKQKVQRNSNTTKTNLVEQKGKVEEDIRIIEENAASGTNTSSCTHNLTAIYQEVEHKMNNCLDDADKFVQKFEEFKNSYNVTNQPQTIQGLVNFRTNNPDAAKAIPYILEQEEKSTEGIALTFLKITVTAKDLKSLGDSQKGESCDYSTEFITKSNNVPRTYQGCITSLSTMTVPSTEGKTGS